MRGCVAMEKTRMLSRIVYYVYVQLTVDTLCFLPGWSAIPIMTP